MPSSACPASLQGALVDEPEASVPGSHVSEPAEGERPSDCVLQVGSSMTGCAAPACLLMRSRCMLTDVPNTPCSNTRATATTAQSRWVGGGLGKLGCCLTAFEAALQP